MRFLIAKRTRDENADMSKNMGEKMDELEYKAKIKPDCDFVISTFDQLPHSSFCRDEWIANSQGILGGCRGTFALAKEQVQ